MATSIVSRSVTTDRWLWGANIILAVIGLLDSIYLTYVKLDRSTPAFCAPGGGCDVVNTSPYSEIFGIPIAVLGAGAYLLFMAALLIEIRIVSLRYTALLIQFGVALIGFLYSVYLTYLELAVIHAICPYCVISAVVLTLLFLISSYRLVKYEPYEDTLDTR